MAAEIEEILERGQPARPLLIAIRIDESLKEESSSKTGNKGKGRMNMTS